MIKNTAICKIRFNENLTAESISFTTEQSHNFSRDGHSYTITTIDGIFNFPIQSTGSLRSYKEIEDFVKAGEQDFIVTSPN